MSDFHQSGVITTFHRLGKYDLEAIEALGVCPVLGDYLEEGDVARHATDKVSRDLLELASQAPPARDRTGSHHTVKAFTRR